VEFYSRQLAAFHAMSDELWWNAPEAIPQTA
jgi:hypothetical protein